MCERHLAIGNRARKRRAEGHVDIALTGIAGANGVTWPPLHWQNVALDAGRFRSSDASGFVAGLLYGPDHEEVGGVFERDRRRGAFGASLQTPAPPPSP